MGHPCIALLYGISMGSFNYVINKPQYYLMHGFTDNANIISGGDTGLKPCDRIGGFKSNQRNIGN